MVLISGGGSNLADLFTRLEAADSPPVDIVAVGSDRQAEGLSHATNRSVPSFVVSLGDFADREAWGLALAERIGSFSPDLVILSGFMKLLPPVVVERFSPQLINTHPAYLPEFPGAHAVADQIAAGVDQAGASVIVVDNGVDTGPILARQRVAVEPGDTEQSLHDRIKQVERQLLWEVLNDPAVLAGHSGGENN